MGDYDDYISYDFNEQRLVGFNYLGNRNKCEDCYGMSYEVQKRCHCQSRKHKNDKQK